MVLYASSISILEKNFTNEQLFCLLGCLLKCGGSVGTQNCVKDLMVLDYLLGSKTKNQAYISLEIRIQTQA